MGSRCRAGCETFGAWGYTNRRPFGATNVEFNEVWSSTKSAKCSALIRSWKSSTANLKLSKFDKSVGVSPSADPIHPPTLTPEEKLNQFIIKALFATVLAYGINAPISADTSAGMSAVDAGDYVTALREFRPSAEQGDPLAQHMIGSIYSHGRGGVPQDYAAAMKWFRKAAEQNFEWSQHDLGVMHYIGKGTPKNYATALKWYHKAAEQGHPWSQYNLCLMYSKGEGTPRNNVKAYKWCSVLHAGTKTDGDTRKMLTEYLKTLASRMNPNQINEAQRLATKWWDEHNQ